MESAEYAFITGMVRNHSTHSLWFTLQVANIDIFNHYLARIFGNQFSNLSGLLCILKGCDPFAMLLLAEPDKRVVSD